MKTFYRKILHAFNLDRDKEFYHRTEESIISGIHFQGFNLYILICAIFICSLGLDVNSTAVIIGAMLISPIMGPIIGMGFGLGTTNWDLLKTAGRNYLIATLIALATSTIYFIISPLNLEQSELLGRTQPTIYDVLIAFFGGFAGIMGTSAKQKGNVIPGVAIATALMPPLCTAGYGLAALNFSFLFGALYLFIINTVFIAMATFLACKLLKMPTFQTDTVKVKQAYKIGLGIALITFLPAVYLGVNLYKKTRFNSNARHFIDEASQLPDNYLFLSKVNYETKSIELVYGGGSISDSIKAIIIAKKKEYGLEKTAIKIVESFSKPIDNINKGLARVHSEMDEKDIKIEQLILQFDSFKFQMLVSETEREFLDKFVSVQQAKLTNYNEDYTFLISLKDDKKDKKGKLIPYVIKEEDSLQMTQFLRQKLAIESIVLKVLK